MKFPICHCGEPSKLSDVPQTKEQFKSGKDNYICKNGHVFEAEIPLQVYNGYAVRADI
jgi:hypothetical protein